MTSRQRLQRLKKWLEPQHLRSALAPACLLSTLLRSNWSRRVWALSILGSHSIESVSVLLRSDKAASGVWPEHAATDMLTGTGYMDVCAFSCVYKNRHAGIAYSLLCCSQKEMGVCIAGHALLYDCKESFCLWH